MSLTTERIISSTTSHTHANSASRSSVSFASGTAASVNSLPLATAGEGGSGRPHCSSALRMALVSLMVQLPRNSALIFLGRLGVAGEGAAQSSEDWMPLLSAVSIASTSRRMRFISSCVVGKKRVSSTVPVTTVTAPVTALVTASGVVGEAVLVVGETAVGEVVLVVGEMAVVEVAALLDGASSGSVGSASPSPSINSSSSSFWLWYTTPFCLKHSSGSSQIAFQLPQPCFFVPSSESRSSSMPHHGAGRTARRGFGSATGCCGRM